MEQTFLLQEVIDNLVNTGESLSSALIRLNYFGRLIKNAELIEYTTNELNGYKGDESQIPDYRQAIGTINLEMQAGYHKHYGILPASMLEEPFKSSLQYVFVREGITVVEKMAKDAANPDFSDIGSAIPLEMLPMLQEPARKLYKSTARIDVVSARLSGNAHVVIEIPDAVRTRLLEFTMSIGESFGYNIEIATFNKKQGANNQTIIHQMNNTINNSGDGNILNTGNDNTLSNNVQLYKGNVERFRSELEKQGIDDHDVKEITEIIATETPNLEEQKLGPKVNGWIMKVLEKSLNGVGKIATGISANLLATLVKQYYGI